MKTNSKKSSNPQDMVLSKLGIAYALVPFKRNQDVIKIHDVEPNEYCIAVVDGWNNPKHPSDISGRKVAQMVADEYPKMFLKLGKVANKRLDDRIIKRYPTGVSAVATFLFHSGKQETIVSIGDVETYLWNGSNWYKSKQIGDHQLDPQRYPSNVSHFFGRGELRDDPIYSSEPDVLSIAPSTSVLIATDGIKDVLSLGDINSIVGNPRGQDPKKIVEKLVAEIQKRKKQKDDISVLVRIPKN